MHLRHRIATIMLLSSTAASASPHTPPSDDKAKPALIKLRTELFEMSPDDAVKALPRFKALCDADGYPLVGNVLHKGQDQQMQPSRACKLLNPDRRP